MTLLTFLSFFRKETYKIRSNTDSLRMLQESVVLSIQEIKQTKVIICKSISRTSFLGANVGFI